MFRPAQHRSLRVGFLAGALGAAVFSACSSNGGAGPSTPVRLGIVAEPSATAQAGLPFAQQPVVQLLDAAGAAVAQRGILVMVSIASGGGALVGESQQRTDGQGRATFTGLGLSGTTGPRTLRFTATGLSSAISSTVTLLPGPVAGATAFAGNNQVVAAGTPVPTFLSVRVTDQDGNPVSGVAVTFTVQTGGGQIANGNATTNDLGVATAGVWTLGTVAGQNSVHATVAGLTAPVVFTAVGVVGPAARITVLEGNQQFGTIGFPVAIPPAVKVTDVANNPVNGVGVNVTVTAGGGTVTPTQPISDVTGRAALTSWQLGLLGGNQSIQFARDGATSLTMTAIALERQVSAISAGAVHVCALGQQPLCWGDNTNGRLGTGDLVPSLTPVAVNTGQIFTQITVGTAHACGLTPAGVAFCWGANTVGQIGDGSFIERQIPVAVTGGHTFLQLSAGANHVCGVRADGAILCWGSGTDGRLGHGLTSNSASPVLALGGHTYTRVSAGSAHTCGLRTDQAILCWGDGGNGRLGDGTIADRSVPGLAQGGGYTAVSAGGSHTCALNLFGNAVCWGQGTSGQLGNGGTVQSTTPVPVTGDHIFASLSVGSVHSCGVTPSGAAYCWGGNGSGRLGDGTTAQRTVPTAVLGGPVFAQISAGIEHTCGRTINGGAVCWGRNVEGQLGDGTQTARSRPAGVSP